jgi:hypothetical protein
MSHNFSWRLLDLHFFFEELESTDWRQLNRLVRDTSYKIYVDIQLDIIKQYTTWNWTHIFLIQSLHCLYCRTALLSLVNFLKLFELSVCTLRSSIVIFRYKRVLLMGRGETNALR